MLLPYSSAILLHLLLEIFGKAHIRKTSLAFPFCSVPSRSLSVWTCFLSQPSTQILQNLLSSPTMTHFSLSLSLSLSPSLPVPPFHNNAHRGLLCGLLFSTDSRASCCTPSFHPQDFSLATMMDLAFATHLKVKLAINTYYSTFFLRSFMN